MERVDKVSLVDAVKPLRQLLLQIPDLRIIFHMPVFQVQDDIVVPAFHVANVIQRYKLSLAAILDHKFFLPLLRLG